MQKVIGFWMIILLFCPMQLWGAEESSPDELKIISITPQGNLNSLDDAGAITLTFNYPVVALFRSREGLPGRAAGHFTGAARKIPLDGNVHAEFYSG